MLSYIYIHVCVPLVNLRHMSLPLANIKGGLLDSHSLSNQCHISSSGGSRVLVVLVTVGLVVMVVMVVVGVARVV